MSVDFFIDTNIAVYTLSTPSLKKEIARSLLIKRPQMSTQVIMEMVNVLIRKFKFTKAEAFESAMNMVKDRELRSVTKYTVVKAFEIAKRNQLSHWDSLIVASALEADCKTLYSEDMQHGLVIEGNLTIVNPFVSIS